MLDRGWRLVDVFEGNVFIGLANRGGDVCPAVSSTPTNTVTELANVDALELNVFNANVPVTARTYESPRARHHGCESCL